MAKNVRWEYTSLPNLSVDQLNKIGLEGWQLCSVDRSHAIGAVFYFKRRWVNNPHKNRQPTQFTKET